MELYGKHAQSLPQKIFVIAAESVILGFSFYLLFGSGFERIGLDMRAGDAWRRALVFAFNCVVFARMAITLFYLMRRAMPLEETISIPLAFAVYYLGFSYFVYDTSHPFDAIDALGIALFAAGSYLNTGSELQRDRWKKAPEHKGKLYTEGLFRYSMHINYFGDILWVTGYALVTRDWYAAIVPAFIFCFFAFFNAPKLDAHLREHYGEQFAEYERTTSKLIPFVY